ncbi:MAG: alpha/beta hydrolase [Candidatus Omnitrophota bacterium]|nr:alpha/beta hydrolase [Candidatus Omnitrophota bacterium]
MRILIYVFVILMLSVNFMKNIANAEDGPEQRRERLRAFLKNRRSRTKMLSVSSQISKKLDVPYSRDSDPLKRMDIYLPERKGSKFPVLIHFHGGGWKMGDKRQTNEHGLFYATQGILFVSVNYRLSPSVLHPAHVEDCAAAVAWVFENLHDFWGDANRVFISGHSAGAHLAALLATDPTYMQRYELHPKRFAGVIPVDTASFDLISRRNERLMGRMIKQAFGVDPKILKSASPLYNISKENVYPEFLIPVSGNRESAVVQTKRLVDSLKSVGGEAEFLVVDNHSHREMNLGMHDADDPVGNAILKFILEKDF